MRPEEGWDGAVLRALSPEWADRVIFLPECDSTNDEARLLAGRGAPDGQVVLTENQRSGRGRRGQRWTCPPGEGLAFSLVVRPLAPSACWSRASLAAGLAVAEALDPFGVAAGVKWPNDIWVAGKKIAGILVEGGSDFLVVGVGLNANVRDFPDDLTFPATSLALERSVPVSREEVLVSVLTRLAPRLGQIDRGFDELRRAWSERCVLSGKVVTLESGGTKMTGRVEGLSTHGELLLRTPSGLARILQASEIREVID